MISLPLPEIEIPLMHKSINGSGKVLEERNNEGKCLFAGLFLKFSRSHIHTLFKGTIE